MRCKIRWLESFDNLPSEFREGDVIRLVRYFKKRKSPLLIRPLHAGELARPRELLPAGLAWIWAGEGEHGAESGRVHYERVMVTGLAEAERCTFSVGDDVSVMDALSGRARVGVIVAMFGQRVGTKSVGDMRCKLRWLQKLDAVESSLLKKSYMQAALGEMCLTDIIAEQKMNTWQDVQGRVLIAYDVDIMMEIEQSVGLQRNTGLDWSEPVRLVRYSYGREAGTLKLRAVNSNWRNLEK